MCRNVRKLNRQVSTSCTLQKKEKAAKGGKGGVPLVVNEEGDDVGVDADGDVEDVPYWTNGPHSSSNSGSSSGSSSSSRKCAALQCL